MSTDIRRLHRSYSNRHRCMTEQSIECYRHFFGVISVEVVHNGFKFFSTTSIPENCFKFLLSTSTDREFPDWWKISNADQVLVLTNKECLLIRTFCYGQWFFMFEEASYTRDNELNTKFISTILCLSVALGRPSHRESPIKQDRE